MIGNQARNWVKIRRKILINYQSSDFFSLDEYPAFEYQKKFERWIAFKYKKDLITYPHVQYIDSNYSRKQSLLSSFHINKLIFGWSTNIYKDIPTAVCKLYCSVKVTSFTHKSYVHDSCESNRSLDRIVLAAATQHSEGFC